MEQQFKPGDFITAYHAGYHRVTRVVRRWENKTQVTPYGKIAYCIIGEHTAECGEELDPHIYYVREFDEKGNPKGSKEHSCIASYCKPASESVAAEIEKWQKIQEKLTLMLKANC